MPKFLKDVLVGVSAVIIAVAVHMVTGWAHTGWIAGALWLMYVWEKD